MTRFFNWLGRLSRPVRWLTVGLLFVGSFTVAVFVSATVWEYTNSPQFCGTTCHTMPPEYTAYQSSPHARVACVDCHLGQDSLILTVPRKAREISHVISALTQDYEPPIYVKNLRPARDTCEQCHNPDKFSSDTFKEIKRYITDTQNSEVRNFTVIKTGGGTARQGLGRGIHWHVENQVQFYSDDPLKQTIPYVRTTDADGKVTEYFDAEAGLPPDFGSTVESQLHRMDCIDCHNRASHLFRAPADAMDNALATGQIDTEIPYIKFQGQQALSGQYATTEEGIAAIQGLKEWYRQNEADYYAANQSKVDDAVAVIQQMFEDTVFPNMKVGWETHPNNLGHKDFPGCFRCHDGKHTSPDGETVRLECNLCHSIPEIVLPGDQAPVIHVERPNEPDSHKDSNWLARHRYVFDETCAQCHDVSNPGGTDNSSFCSNSACHGADWKFAGLNAVAIRELVAPPKVPGSGTPKPIPHPIDTRTDCTICHGSGGVRPYPESHASFTTSQCTQCHASPASGVSGTPPTGQATAQPPAAIPAIPHTLEGRANCTTCHGPNGFKPYPADHAGRPVESCTGCHHVASTGETPASTVAPTATRLAPTNTPTAAATTAPTPTRAATTAATAVATSAATATSRPTTAPTVATVAATTAPPATVTPNATAGAGGAAPTIPHPVAGRENMCVTCHAAGGVKPMPADHAGRTNEMCLVCHRPE